MMICNPSLDCLDKIKNALENKPDDEFSKFYESNKDYFAWAAEQIEKFDFDTCYETAKRVVRTEERKREYKRKTDIKDVIKTKREMSIEDRIELANMSYDDVPEELKPGLVKRAQAFNFIKMLNPNAGNQHEVMAARLLRLRKKFGYTEDRTEEIVNKLNAYTKLFPVIAADGRKHTVIFKPMEYINYECLNVCPKIDRMVAIAKVFNVSLEYIAGYGDDEVPDTAHDGYMSA